MRLIEIIKSKFNEIKDDYKEKSKERRKINKEIKAEADTAYTEERKTQAIATAKFKAQRQGKKKREYIKQGGFMGAISREADKIGKTAPKGKAKPFDLSEMPKVFPESKKEKEFKNITDFKMEF